MRFVSVIAAIAAASALDLTAPAIHHDLVNQVNQAGLTWKAGMNSKFINMTLGEAKKLMGTKRRTALNVAAKARHSAWDLEEMPTSALPAAFDVRTNFPWASNITSVVRDQSACGSCWAFGSTEAFNDRLAIAKNFSTLLSAADTMSCCSGFSCLGSSGCDGGIPDEAWSWFTQTGVVTGAGNDEMTDGRTCYPYPFEICEHHISNPKYPACPEAEFSTPSCPTSCPDTGYSVPYTQDKHMASSSYNLQSVQAAMTDIFTRGTMTVAFDVYQDFLTYTSGVYTCPTSGQPLGGHAVSIIGWGTEGGVDYWLVRNSWNPTWGAGGLFKIRRGTDECGIEDDMVAGAV